MKKKILIILSIPVILIGIFLAMIGISYISTGYPLGIYPLNKFCPNHNKTEESENIIIEVDELVISRAGWRVCDKCGRGIY